MSLPSTFMGLTLWDQGTDPYSHLQLANNFAAIDTHDHQVGHGVQVPEGGILNGAITTPKIRADAVTPDKIPNKTLTQQEIALLAVGTPELIDAAVTTAKIADGAVTAAKLEASIIPIGQCILWYHVDQNQLPAGFWEPLDGRAWSAVVNKMGPGGGQLNTGNMPDTRNAFPLGAALSGTGSTFSTPPTLGQVGGSHTYNLNHAHAVAGHAHTVPDHIHGLPDHAHGIFGDGAHSHGMHSRQTRTLRQDQTGNDSYLQTLYVAGFNSGGGDAAVPASGSHSHGGATAGVGAWSSFGSGAFSTSVNGSTTDAQLSVTQDIRPKFVGFLILCRVR